MSRHVTLFRSLALAAGLMVGLSSASAQQQQGLTREQMAEMEKALQAPLLPTHLAVATDVLKASGLMTMFNNAMPNVVGALRVNVTRTRPELTKDIEASLKVVEAETTRIAADGLGGAARFLAVKMNEAELKEVLAFMTSSAGKKYVESLPPFMEQVVPYLELWSAEAGGRLAKTFQDEMAKRGHKL